MPSREELTCPVCGYYCLGKGGIGCIDKPGMFKDIIQNQEELGKKFKDILYKNLNDLYQE